MNFFCILHEIFLYVYIQLWSVLCYPYIKGGNLFMDINATGQTLKYFRKRANLTQKDVAKSMLKSQQWVSDTENGVSTLLWGDLKKICKLYNTTPSEFERKENEFM